MIKNIYYLIVFFFISKSVISQNQEFVVAGKIVDETTLMPLSGTSIKIGNEGVTSNKDGFFSIHRSKQFLSKSNIHITHVEYRDTTIAYIESYGFLFIKMSRKNTTLPEIILQSGAKDIITKAVNLLCSNYPTTAFNSFGYHIATETINDSLNIYYDTAVIKNYNSSYCKKKLQMQTSVLQNKYRSIRSDTINNYKKWIGSYSIIKGADYVFRKTLFIGDINAFTYRRMPNILFEGKPAYVIRFENKDSSLHQEGTVYIDIKSYAILNIENHFLPSFNKEYQPVFNDRMLFTSVNAKYKLINGVYYLYECNADNFRVINSDKINKSYLMRFSSFYRMLFIDTLNTKKIISLERVNSKTSLTDVRKPNVVFDWNEIENKLYKGNIKITE